MNPKLLQAIIGVVVVGAALDGLMYYKKYVEPSAAEVPAANQTSSTPASSEPDPYSKF